MGLDEGSQRSGPGFTAFHLQHQFLGQRLLLLVEQAGLLLQPFVDQMRVRDAELREYDDMLAVDTDVVVRYVTRDHAEQSAKAKTLIDGNDVFVPTTVLLETDWVLRSGYEFTRTEIAAALR